nr:hypothetical protein BaRGS_030381 [Batillaria attramentaria]
MLYTWYLNCLQFVTLNTERDLDFVEIWVGGSTLSNSILVQRVSGTTADFSTIGLTVSNNNLAIVRFLSDGNYQDSGFRLTWQSGISAVPGQGGELYATSNFQRFFSPLYPMYHMGDLAAKWVIHAPGRQVVTLQILDLDLAAGDNISVYDGGDTAATQLATMSGSDVTAVAKTTAGCTFSIVANSGRIVSPGYRTSRYPNILECTWDIQAEAGRSLTLSFDSTFALEDGKDFLEPCGAMSISVEMDSSGQIRLVMKTGATGRAAGFAATFNAGCEPINDPTLLQTYSADYDQSIVVRLLGVNTRTLRARCVWDEVSRSYRVDVNQLRCDTSGVDCGVPRRLPGSLPYTVLSTSYSAQFTFTCRTPLFTRVGSSSINQNEIVQCGPTCPDPGTEPGSIQVATTYEEFSYVSYRCLRAGFGLTYPWPLYCQYDSGTNSLTWNGTAPSCTDVEPPSFANCPTQVRRVSYLASALYAEPVPTDNVMVQELTISPVDFRTTDVIENSLQVSYIARDHAGNIGTCVVTIQIRDDSPPTIRCQDSIELQLNSESQRAIYDPLTFVDSQADNSGIVSLSFTINPLITDYFTTGNTYTIRINADNIGDTYTVKIDGEDPSGNSDSCLVQIRVTGWYYTDYRLEYQLDYRIRNLDATPNSEAAITQCATTVTSAFTSVSSSLQSIRSLNLQNNCPASETVRYRQTLRNAVNCQINQESRVEPATSRYQCGPCQPGNYSFDGFTPCTSMYGALSLLYMLNGVCQSVVTNPCESNPCQNGATCYQNVGSSAGAQGHGSQKWIDEEFEELKETPEDTNSDGPYISDLSPDQDIPRPVLPNTEDKDHATEDNATANSASHNEGNADQQSPTPLLVTEGLPQEADDETFVKVPVRNRYDALTRLNVEENLVSDAEKKKSEVQTGDGNSKDPPTPQIPCRL